MKKKVYVLNLILVVFVFLGSFAVRKVLAKEALMAGGPHGLTFAVMADPHLMAPALVIRDGRALEEYISEDRKLLKESDAITDRVVSEILEKKPAFVLVCGDLTKDGEKVSHERFADKYLSRFEKAGIKVYVIPGNHDISNPHAVCFDGDETKRVATVTAEEFAEIYKDYGYGDVLAHDTASLTYSVEVAPSLVLIAIDDCKYYENDFNKNTCITSGAIKDATLEFIQKEAEKAHENGCKVIAMVHHGIVEHWKWQSKAMSEYLVDDWKKQVRFFARNGINVVFTGHFHAQDVAEKHGVYDIETGSSVTYPCPYRMVTIDGDKMVVQSFFVEKINYPLPGEESFHRYAHDFLEKEMPNIIKGMFSDKLPDSCRMKAAKTVSKAYVANLAGDEKYTESDKEEVKSLARQIKHYSRKDAYIFSHVSKYLWQNMDPADGNLIIKFN